jgi:hypothetical protein
VPAEWLTAHERAGDRPVQVEIPDIELLTGQGQVRRASRIDATG